MRWNFNVKFSWGSWNKLRNDVEYKHILQNLWKYSTYSTGWEFSIMKVSLISSIPRNYPSQITRDILHLTQYCCNFPSLNAYRLHFNAPKHFSLSMCFAQGNLDVRNNESVQARWEANFEKAVVIFNSCNEKSLSFSYFWELSCFSTTWIV